MSSEEEALKALQVQNEELRHSTRRKEMQRLEMENDMLRRQLDGDPGAQQRETWNLHRDGDSGVEKRETWNLHRDSDPGVQKRETWNLHRDSWDYGDCSPTVPLDISGGPDATRRGPIRQPQIKLPTFDGTVHIDELLIPFERLADKYHWTESDKIDNLFQSIKGTAMQYICSLPRDVTSNYRLLTGHLSKRFGYRDPASSVRRRLSELRQRNSETNETFADEVRKLTTRAYPGMEMQMLDQLAAEAFLKGFKNSKIAYEAMNKKPASLNEALEIVTCLEHNYKATVARDLVDKTRKVTFETNTEGEAAINLRRIHPSPTYTTINQLDHRMTNVEKMLEQILKQTKTPDSTCYNCGEPGHFARECQQLHGRSGYERHRAQSPGRTPVRRVQEDPDYDNELPYHSTPNPDNERSDHEEYETEETTQVKVNSLSGNDREARRIYLPITVNKEKLWAVVDTGAEATVVSVKIAEQAGIKPGNKMCKLLNAEDNVEMVAYGGVTATFQIANISKEWPVYVAPIRDELILGLDIMKAMDMNVLSKQGDVTIEGVLISGRYSEEEEVYPVPVTAKEDTLIKPISEQLMIGRVSVRNEGEQDVVLDPSTLTNGLQIVSALVDRKEDIPVRIRNLSDRPVKLSKSTPHPATSFTPSRLMLGREVLMPQDTRFQSALENKKTNAKTWSEALEENLRVCQDIATDVLQAEKVTQKRVHDLTAVQNRHDVGDLVLVSNEAKKNVWQGPFIIMKKIGSVIFEVMNQKGRTILHHNRVRLKRFTSESVPAWVQKQRKARTWPGNSETGEKLDNESSLRTSFEGKTAPLSRGPDTPVCDPELVASPEVKPAPMHSSPNPVSNDKSSLRTSSAVKPATTPSSPNPVSKHESSLRTSPAAKPATVHDSHNPGSNHESSLRTSSTAKPASRPSRSESTTGDESHAKRPRNQTTATSSGRLSRPPERLDL